MLNKILLYPTKMDFFALEYGDIKSLEPKIDKRSLRHATTFQLDSKDFSLEDFKIFSEMELTRLEKVNIQIVNINDCEVLKYILAILKNVKHFELSIKSTKSKGKTLNDNCLERHFPS